ncbi:MAG TPA: hypothetical protein VE619_01355 [Nitrososphaeraceae archaeon]|nr:hypothetical protein [Nitrososphaeraceae archaeon]
MTAVEQLANAATGSTIITTTFCKCWFKLMGRWHFQCSAYSATKFAIEGLSESIAYERALWNPSGIDRTKSNSQ